MLEELELSAPRRLSAMTVSAGVLGVALVCWIVALHQMDGMDMGPGTDPGTFWFFLGAWVTMMAAMMLPSTLPMVLFFQRIGAARRAEGSEAVSTGVFVLAYLAVWALFGVAAFGLYRAVRGLDLGFLAWDRQGPIVAGATVAAAGIYELTPLKWACLRRCRSPLQFLLGRWKPGTRGAVAMGTEHGAWCAGCCWGLMVILFALGVMSLTWMLVVAGVIFAQKVLPWGQRVQWALAAGLVGLGVWIAVDPGSVPGLVQPAMMPAMTM
jgi:predicted metal-binding membrane protein